MLPTLLLLTVSFFPQTQPACETNVSIILSDKRLLVNECDARKEYDQLSRLKTLTHDQAKRLSALHISLSVKAAIRQHNRQVQIQDQQVREHLEDMELELKVHMCKVGHREWCVQ